MINLTINNLFLGRFQLETAVRIAQRLSEMFPGIVAIFEKVPHESCSLSEALKVQR